MGIVHYQGPIFTVHEEHVLDGGAGRRRFDVVRKRSCIAVLAIDDEQSAVLVQQYRHPIGKEMLEVVAGIIDPGETPIEAAKRELLEEVNYTADSWVDLGEMVVSPGWTDEKIYMFLAQGLKSAEGHQDPDERITIIRMPLNHFADMIDGGRINDGKTVVTWYHSLQYLIPAIELLEDQEAAEASLAEEGENIPLETVRAELGV